ncbi:MAG: methylaspartate ammonia-lyase [Defluviitaleaceae bacterium]|nr:methylaspartate ammonia-lyase [Defluviitaleaceae bacterium]
MNITHITCSPGRTGFFFDDQAAIKRGAKTDGNTYIGDPVTPGFTKIRMAGESISVMIRLEDGQVAYGDCAAVQYSGAGGRDPVFLATDFIPIIEREIMPLLVGKPITSFREMAALVDKHIDSKTGKPLHTAIRFGVTQALLDAVARSRNKLMAQVVADEYGQTLSTQIIPIFTQSGDDRYGNTDKMIIKGADALSHGLFNTLDKLGRQGEKLIEYLHWIVKRIDELAPCDGYAPTLHMDVYGTIGMAFDNDIPRIADYFAQLEAAAKPLALRIEGPIDMGEREAQIQALAELTSQLDAREIKVEVVADEWCNTFEDVREFAERKAGHQIQIKVPDLGGINNTIEAVITCKKLGAGAYVGGTCNETDRSAQVTMHVAMATSPVQVLAKPGMGVDEAFMICYNEMQRILAISKLT